MDTFSKQIFGDRFEDKSKKFKRGTEEIDKKYSDYFESREPMLEGQKHDTINNHFNLVTMSNGLTYLVFSENSDLRSDIKKELRDLFDRISKT